MTEKPIQITAKVRIKSVYGRDLIYPANDKAELLARIANTQTLTESTVALAKELGIVFEIEAEAKTL